jgi:hypothetical protein
LILLFAKVVAAAAATVEVAVAGKQDDDVNLVFSLYFPG